MTASPYRLFGAELSPYSVKVRSWLRYKQVPHQWIVRSPATQAEFQKYARLPLVPLLVTPEDEGMQDSTPILEALEERHPEPPGQPSDPALAFLSYFLEETADEWVNKPMFHYRWWREVDRRSAGERIARILVGDEAPEEALAGATAAVVDRMVPRLSFVGSSEQTAPLIERSFDELLSRVESQLEGRSYLFGGRPVLADFGLWGQLYQTASDPTAGALMRERSPRTLDWVERMLEPRAEGELESLERLAPTLEPLLANQGARWFLPWTAANARALAAGEESFEVELAGEPFRQQTQKYHARSFGVLRERYRGVAGAPGLAALLERTDCLRWLE